MADRYAHYDYETIPAETRAHACELVSQAIAAGEGTLAWRACIEACDKLMASWAGPLHQA